jgi:hypothetical protein
MLLKSFDFMSAPTHEECVHRLRARTENQWFCAHPQQQAGRRYVGDTSFRIRKRIVDRNSFQPRLSGELRDEGGRSRPCPFGMHPAVVASRQPAISAQPANRSAPPDLRCSRDSATRAKGLHMHKRRALLRRLRLGELRESGPTWQTKYSLRKHWAVGLGDVAVAAGRITRQSVTFADRHAQGARARGCARGIACQVLCPEVQLS